ncbi:UDG inhibitor [Bacillus phage BeachBum]|uniref:UDG inhibitor n=1 Tax=Bacillus phage BeachBum TaxID=1983461 RepID=A0A1X9SGH2_9CAUD|nr:UDG inhibitor [Bacillus phage BeachBum]ARQ95223.1 UDG inhibitor [Bacillus phage BeachBum]
MNNHFMSIGRNCSKCNNVRLNEDFSKSEEICNECFDKEERFVDSYTLIYITEDETGKRFEAILENQTIEETEIIYGNIIDKIIVWNVILTM